MKYHRSYPYSSSDPAVDLPLLALGLWMRAIWIGAALALIGVVMLLNAEAERGLATVLVLSGAVLTRMSWRRTRAHLGAVDASDPKAVAAANANSTQTASRAPAREAAPRDVLASGGLAAMQ